MSKNPFKSVKNIFLFCFIMYSTLGISQNIGDTLYAARKNGVPVYSQSDFSSATLGTLAINAEIIVQRKLRLDTSDFRIGNWYKIKSKQFKEGYVFGGSLNRQKISTHLASLNDAIQSLESQYTILYSSSHGKSPEYLGTDDIIVHVRGSRYHTRIDEIFWEGFASELYFFDVDVAEMLNIIENIDQEVSTDYKHIISSLNEGDLTKFQWTSGENDPGLPEVTLEKRAQGGILIYIVAGL